MSTPTTTKIPGSAILAMTDDQKFDFTVPAPPTWKPITVQMLGKEVVVGSKVRDRVYHDGTRTVDHIGPSWVVFTDGAHNTHQGFARFYELMVPAVAPADH